MNKTKNRPDNWNILLLGKICNIVRGSSPRPKGDPRYYGGNVPRLMVEDVTRDGMYVFPSVDFLTEEGSKQSRKMKAGELVIVVSGNPGVPAILGIEAFIHDGFAGLRDLDQSLIMTEYLYYYLKFYKNKLNSQATGAIFQNLTTLQLAKIPIPLPPLAEQKQIVAILQEADALRHKKKEILEKSNRLASALFLEMFGDPVRNEKGWKNSKLGNIIKFKSGESITVSKLNASEGFPVYGGNGINGYYTKYMFEKPMIVIGRVGAYCGVIHLSEPFSWITDNALFVSEFFIETNIIFLSYALRMANLNQYAGRAAQPLVSGNRLYPINFILPPLPLQNDFAKKVEAIEETTKQIESSLQKMEKLYDSLLQKAFTGELTESWRKRNPDAGASKPKVTKLQLQAFNNDLEVDTKTSEEVTKKKSISPLKNGHRMWIKKQLSEEQEFLLHKFWRWGGFIHSENIDIFIGESLYKNEFWSGEEGKARTFRILNQLTGIGLVEKATLQTNEFNFVTVYRLLEENDRNRTQKSDIEKIRYPL